MFKCKYCGKEFEKKQQLAGHIIWCKENPNRSGKSNFHNKKYENDIRPQDVIRDDLFCQYCGKKCKNLNSLRQHEIRCKENPNKISNINKHPISGFKKYNERIKNGEINVWNKNLTKEDHPSIKKQGETYSQRAKDGIIFTGGYRENAVKGCYKYGYYKGIRCDSSWELAFVVYCIENNIPIIRNTHRYKYEINGVKHNFIPDFIVNGNEIIEIKGMQDIAWEIKQANFPFIKFIMKDEIKFYINYVISKYGKEYWNILYDK